MKKVTLIAMIVVLALLSGGCGPGTSESLFCATMDEFTERFGEKFAIPTYFPSGFAPDDEGVLFSSGGTFTKEAFQKQGRGGYKNYKGFDIFSSIGITMSPGVDMDATYNVSSIGISRPMTEVDADWWDDFQAIPDNQYGASIYEFVGAPVEDLTQEHGLYTYINIPLDQAIYSFIFTTHINPIPDEDSYTAVREKIRAYCIEEAVKMYESLEYVN